jgi:hypothetical protein
MTQKKAHTTESYESRLEKRAAEVAQVLLPHFPVAEHPKVKQFALAAVSIFDNTAPAPSADLDDRRATIKQVRASLIHFLKSVGGANAKIKNIHRVPWSQSNVLAEAMGKPLDLDGLPLKEIRASEGLHNASRAVLVAAAKYLRALEVIEELTPTPKRTGRRAGNGTNSLAVVAAWWWQFFGMPPTTTDTGPFHAAAAALLHVDNPDKQVRRAVAAVLDFGPPGPPPPQMSRWLDLRMDVAAPPPRVPRL